jgi:hypothetical protein
MRTGPAGSRRRSIAHVRSSCNVGSACVPLVHAPGSGCRTNASSYAGSVVSPSCR